LCCALIIVDVRFGLGFVWEQSGFRRAKLGMLHFRNCSFGFFSFVMKHFQQIGKTGFKIVWHVDSSFYNIINLCKFNFDN
jgi:hypothetical protein